MENFSYEVGDLEDLPDSALVDNEEDFLESDHENLDKSADIDFEALGINPGAPTTAKPGSEEKIFVLAARVAAHVPLWHEEDCIDHGPSEALQRLLSGEST
jgi:hypothetical protein